LRDRSAAAEFDLVLITAPDRLARNYVHQVLLLEELQGRGCRVEFLDRPMSQDPHDQLLLQIRGAVAEYERTLITERMRRGRLAKLRAGALLLWTRPPYGYRDVRWPVRRDTSCLAIFITAAPVKRALGVGCLSSIVRPGLPQPSSWMNWSGATCVNYYLTLN
jgi:DNA invertase Pin-like site-specific DNA recombinase